MSPTMDGLPENFQTAPLAEVDPAIAAVLDGELKRQQGTLEMIASENFVPQAGYPLYPQLSPASV